MSDGARLASLLATLSSATPSFTIFELADGVRLLGPPVDGVAALLVLSGTMVLEDHDAPARPVRAGRLALLPSGSRASITASEAPAVVTLESRRCLVQRSGWLVADATRGREPALTVAAARIAGSSPDALDRPLVTSIVGSEVGRPLFTLLRAEWGRGAAGHPALAMSLMSACVVQGLRREIEAGPLAPPAAETGARGLIGRAVSAIHAQPAAQHNVDTLARVAGMSRSTFVRHFRRIMRLAPMEYLQRVRLDEAQAMLRATALPIKAVAAATGFASRSHFSRLFRDAFGCDPSGYRVQANADHGRQPVNGVGSAQ